LDLKVRSLEKDITIENIYRFFKQKVDGLSSGHEKRTGGDLAVGDVLSGAGRAIRCCAATPEGRRRREWHRGPSWDWGGFEDSVIRIDMSLENIYAFFCIGCLYIGN
jgi:hypothetical protein